MKKKKLTNGIIEKNTGSINLDISNNDLFKDKKNLLIVYANTMKFSRYLIYPISSDSLLKVTLSSLKENVKNLEEISSLLNNFDIIHNSGLTIRNEFFIFETYLNLKTSDIKYKDLKTSLDKIKNKFIDIDIEEIRLSI